MHIVNRISRIILGTTQKTRIVSSVSLIFAVCAFGAAAVAPATLPDDADFTIKAIKEEISLPSVDEQLAKLKTDQQFYVREDKVHASDTLATLFARLYIDDTDAVAFIKSNATAKGILGLRAGYLVQAKTDHNGLLYWLSVTNTVETSPVSIVVTRTESGFNATTQNNTIEKRLEMRTGVIVSSLFAATDIAEIPDAITHQLIDMFATNIDFSSELRRGDSFNVIFETFWQNGTYLRAGRILAANFTNNGNSYQTVWFDAGGRRSGGYYSFDGRPLKRAFLKAPLQYSRISSGYGLRVHPVFGDFRNHAGIDFAAPTGTPVYAAADGFIEFVGQQGAYGNFIVIKHWSSYSTAYGHLSRFASKVHKGKKVSQGETIGYVGSTGRSTGPHLHYEFRVDNQFKNPKEVEMPNIQPLTASEMEKFRMIIADMRHRFTLMSPGSSVTVAQVKK